MYIAVSREKLSEWKAICHFGKIQSELLHAIQGPYPSAEVDKVTSTRMSVVIEGIVYRVGIEEKGIHLISHKVRIEKIQNPETNDPNLAVRTLERFDRGWLIVLPKERTEYFMSLSLSRIKDPLMEEIRGIFPHAKFLSTKSPRFHFSVGDLSYRLGINSHGIYFIQDDVDLLSEGEIHLGAGENHGTVIRRVLSLLGSAAGFIGGANNTAGIKNWIVGIFEKNGEYYRLVCTDAEYRLVGGWKYRTQFIRRSMMDQYMTMNYPDAEPMTIQEVNTIYRKNRTAGRILPLRMAGFIENT